MRRKAPDPLADPTPSAAFGIRAVSHLTGVDEHTLRIWERRYGFPQPERSSGGTRLYSASDVQRLKLVKAALARGHRPGEVVAQDAAALERLLEVAPTAANTTAPPLEPLLNALTSEDVPALRAGLRQLALLLGPRRFVVDVAQPLAVRAGELWAAGQLEVHQEHLLSDNLSTQLRLLRTVFDDTPGPVVVLATLPGEPHGLGLDMVALYMATAGLAPRVIGMSTPPEQIVRAAHAHHAAVVGLSVLPSSDLAAVERQVRAIRPALPRASQLWIGGAGAASLPVLDGVRVVSDWAELDAATLALLAERGLPMPESR